MTFEEFKNKALHPKECDEPGVYKVKLYKYYIDSPYPTLEMEEDHESLYSTFEEAKKFVTGFSGTKDSKPYCSFISFHKFGEEASKGYFNKLWLFDPEGNLLDESLSPGTVECYYNPFRGRPVNKIRFKTGDIVEVMDLDELTAYLAIVARHPISIEKAWEINLKQCQKKGESGLECEPGEDEIATLMTEDDHYSVIRISDDKVDFDSSHVHPTLIMNPHIEISNDLKLKLTDKLKEYLNKGKYE